ncbi:DNA-directed DNA polymerase gamma mip1 [Diplodia intermedia]|uniref:DNA-directed DNA polymerase n=1 Tax=Diplodia intermedia TaxID=856260 RepID=A0ABR3U111_9PEZI
MLRTSSPLFARRFCPFACAPLLRPPRQYAPSDAAMRNRLRAPTKVGLEACSVYARLNDVGVQQLSAHAHSQIFASKPEPPPKELVDLSIDHLTRHDLFGKNSDEAPPISFDMPPLQGSTKTLDEHFYRLGMDSAHPYLDLAQEFVLKEPPARPQWVERSGWTKYVGGTWEAVDAPDESLLTFDVEVMWKETSYACMACAASPTAWYAWISPWLLGESDTDRHLIPLGDPTKPRIVVGHNIGYDRARIAEEYDLRQSKNFFMDTMSLHVAVNGMCSRQRPKWMKHRKEKELRDKIAASDENVDLNSLLQSGQLSDEEEELWIGRSSINSLRDVAKFHCNITIEKAQREYFGELDRGGVREKLSELLDYCAADVQITHRVYQKVFPLFHEVCPHPVSFAALRFMGTEILPINESWNEYIKNAEEKYQTLSEQVQQRLITLADTALEVKEEPEKYQNDPWLSQLDWSGQEIKMVKGKKKNDPPRPAARQKLPGMPKWYKDLYPKATGPISLTTRTRVAPLFLRLAWDGYPLFWTDKYGWTYRVPVQGAQLNDEMKAALCDFSEDENITLRLDREHHYIKIPHKDGPTARCTNPLAKSYQQFFENGRLTSEYAYAKEALEMNASCSYWISARDRIRSQMAVFEGEAMVNGKPQSSSQTGDGASGSTLGYILPQVIPMGTITRRAVENTWLTASNAKKNRVGSELKSMVRAPPGYCFVGADVDSEELWIASLLGDAQFKLHGGNAIGFMTLEGSKPAGTDLHSRTASILGISRNDAKVFNYGRIYGAGLKFASTLLRQFNPSLTEAQTTETASRLYQETKGKKTTRKALQERSFWRGGTESFVFNKLEDFAEQEKPRTPVLGAGITEALTKRYLTKGSFITSRINWAIQSSGVDYLHLLIVSMDYLTRHFNIDARLALTVHDEIRYIVKEEDKYRAALALQVSNIWTRAMFSQQVGIEDLPQACAFFSAVDIDHVLRKEVDMDCVTPSHQTPISPGESVDILTLLDKGDEARLNRPDKPAPEIALKPDAVEYKPREPVMTALQSTTNIPFVRAQITADDQELLEIMRSIRPKEVASGPFSPTKPKRSTTNTPAEWKKARKNVPRPPHSQPQAAYLLPVEHWDERAFFRNLERPKPSWGPAHQPHQPQGPVGPRSWGRL